MLIDRFGDTYAGAYVLPPGNAEDDWASERPPVTARVGHMNGAYDFFGAQNYPLAPLTVRRKMMVMASDWAGVETALDNLMTYTILAGESKLWGLQHDGTTTVWTTAKCTAFTVEESATEIETGVPVTLEFFCREGGVWHSGAEHEYANTSTNIFEITNVGAQAAQVRFVLVNAFAEGNTPVTLVSVMNDTTEEWFHFTGTLELEDELLVDSANQICTVTPFGGSPVPAYADLVIPVGQTSWLTLQPGTNLMIVDVTPAQDLLMYHLYWSDTY